MTYSYSPAQIRKRGKDQMRFELGDTQVEWGAETCALADEEYEALLEELPPGKRAWQLAKLNVLEAILFKLSYQVDTRVDVLSYGLGARAAHWKELYEMLNKELSGSSCVPTMAESKPAYFHTDMHTANN
jgi:hypothetical protein